MAGSIIIADDEPHLTHMLALKVRQQGFAVTVASNGREALDAALHSTPDLIITDYQMPLLDGISLAKELHLHERLRKVPLIMLTARGHRVSQDDLAQTSIRHLMPKPFSARDVLQKVNEMLKASAAPTETTPQAQSA